VPSRLNPTVANEDRHTERVALLTNITFISNQLRVYVLSVSGWSWAIAWAQIGVAFLYCVAFTDKAAAELTELQAHPSLGPLINRVPVTDSDDTERDNVLPPTPHQGFGRLVPTPR
jgi:hypothetical protein